MANTAGPMEQDHFICVDEVEQLDNITSPKYAVVCKLHVSNTVAEQTTKLANLQRI